MTTLEVAAARYCWRVAGEGSSEVEVLLGRWQLESALVEDWSYTGPAFWYLLGQGERERVLVFLLSFTHAHAQAHTRSLIHVCTILLPLTLARALSLCVFEWIPLAVVQDDSYLSRLLRLQDDPAR